MLTTIIALAAAGVSAPDVPTAPAGTPATLQSWVERVNQRVEKRLRVPDRDEIGMATVSFRRDENGRPADIKVNSGNMSIARAAIQTIRAAGTLPPMPAGMASSQRITFKFLVGMTGHEEEYERDRARMLESANRTNMAVAARLGQATQLAAVERR